jgi:hypothetical protein
MKSNLMVFSLVFVALAALTGALAQEDGAGTTEETNVSLPDPDITPDNPFWAFDRLFERIDLFLTFDRSAKAEKGLAHARERLAEVNAMIAANRLDAATTAQEAFDEDMAGVETEVDALSESNATDEVTKVVGIEKKVSDTKLLLGDIEVRIKVRGNLTDEQQALIDSILANLGNTTSKVEIKIVNKKEESKVKIKIQTGRTDAEVEEEVRSIERRIGINLEERAAEAIEDAKEEIAEAETELGNQTSVLLNEAKRRLAAAEDAFAAGNFGEAFGQATAAEQLAKSAERTVRDIDEDENENEPDEVDEREDNETSDRDRSGRNGGDGEDSGSGEGDDSEGNDTDDNSGSGS